MPVQPDTQHAHLSRTLLHQLFLRPGSKRPRLLALLLVLLALFVFTHYITATHTNSLTATSNNCLDLLRHHDYTKDLAFQPQTQEMEAIQFLDERIAQQPLALVQVARKSEQRPLDVYLYGCTQQSSRTTPTVLLQQRGLAHGTVNVTRAGTLNISQFDTTLPPETSMLLPPLQQSIHREYIWHKNMFIQVVFPGLYPVLTRSEAEALQDATNNGQNQLWQDPLTTTEQMAKDLFQWPPDDLHVTLQDNDGTTAHVLLSQNGHQKKVMVTLSRLIQRNHMGIWFVTGAQTEGITLDQAKLKQVVTSPLTIRGTIQSYGGQTSVKLFDHTLTPLKIQDPPVFSIDEAGTYNSTIYYSNTQVNQPGLLLIEEVPTDEHTTAGQLLLTNLLLA